LKHGTGAIDIDGCRIPTSEEPRNYLQEKSAGMNCGDSGFGNNLKKNVDFMNEGRFPANICVSQRIDIAINDLLEAKSILLDKWQYPSV